MDGRATSGACASTTPAELITDNEVWHVPGRSSITGDCQGRETTFAYFNRLYELANGIYQGELHVAVGDDEHLISIDHRSAR